LVIANGDMWSLPEYEGFRRHLDERYRLVKDAGCLIFALDGLPLDDDPMRKAPAEAGAP